MVRRAILDRGDTVMSEDQALPASQFRAEPVQQPGRPWRGAGGRWLSWAGRAIVWAVLLLIGYRGVLAIVTGLHPANRPATASISTSRGVDGAFPVSLAEAYALEFGDAYLNFSPATAGTRAQELARLVAPGLDPQLGWNGAGTQRLQTEQVASISVRNAHTAVVVLLASLDGGRVIELGVPVYAAHGGISISGLPAPLPAPPLAALPVTSLPSGDQATQAALQSQLPAFFAAYASGDRTTLARFAAPGSHIRSLAGVVIFGGINALYAPAGGTVRTITVTVTWRLDNPAASSGTVGSAPAAFQAAYQLTVIRQGGSWDVQSIAALAPGAGPS